MLPPSDGKAENSKHALNPFFVAAKSLCQFYETRGPARGSVEDVIFESNKLRRIKLFSKQLSTS
jgi:hypothetical protein